MKQHSSTIKMVILTCIFVLCFGSILWYMRVQKLAETSDSSADSNAPTITSISEDVDTRPTQIPVDSDTQPTQAPSISEVPPTQIPTDSDTQPTQTPSISEVPPTQIPTVSDTQPTSVPTKEDTITQDGSDTTITPSPSPIPEVANGTVTLCLTGDLMCLAGQQYAAELADGTHDFSGSFSLIKEQLQSCDFVIGNLETLISESHPYTTELKEVVEGCPNCNAPTDYLAALKDAGFTTLVTCNNHSYDGGTTGVNETLQNLDTYEFAHTGTYTVSDTNSDTPLTERFLILEKNGIKIGLVAFTELINLRSALPAKEMEQIINCYSQAFATELITAARDAGADYVIAYNHWGSENTHEVRDYQCSHAQALADAGADLIIGSHPHCLQEVTTLTTEDGREVLCFYSLGNLVSSMARDINNDTLLLTISLTKESDTIQLSELSLTPCHVMGYLNGSSHVIVPVNYPVERENHKTELQEAEQRIQGALNLSW